MTFMGWSGSPWGMGVVMVGFSVEGGLRRRVGVYDQCAGRVRLWRDRRAEWRLMVKWHRRVRGMVEGGVGAEVGGEKFSLDPKFSPGGNGG